ncbi:N-acetylmuramoyl-L-alanine amidase [Youngiibacter multivorans]|uniref:N-acetylmuramoyl-L-alanine amidase n=1 Tax=Youngiibacter multivorans TaxID=937251 RepID=A0ABS4G1G1_9CLOT|nr:N-acetylmuramoyl-L-alanine amidase [Youngiibacter multivorans]MBP1918384.1 N-acetylmuramoyl-L-alanine amidase [Youngiibacter multivorans]
MDLRKCFFAIIVIVSLALSGCAQKEYVMANPEPSKQSYSKLYEDARDYIASDRFDEAEEILKKIAQDQNEKEARAMMKEINTLKESLHSYTKASELLDSGKFRESFESLMEVSSLDTKRLTLVPEMTVKIRKAVLEKAEGLRTSGNDAEAKELLEDYLMSDPGAESVIAYVGRLNSPQPTMTKPTETDPLPTIAIPLPTEPAVEAPTETILPKEVYVVTLDPGHQLNGSSRLEPIGPDSTVMKPRVSSGTMGIETKIPEHELVLDLSLRVRELLIEKGIEVVMTRTVAEVDLSNIDRAKIANENSSDLFVRIHANGANDTSVSGISAYYPSTNNQWAGQLSSDSRRASNLILEGIVRETGAKDRGARASDSYTGINWSEVPVTIIETGFMTNPDEDLLISTDEYRQKMAIGIAEGIIAFLGL